MTDLPPRSVLAPVDFSDLSKHALDVADRIATERTANITLMHVHPIRQTTFLDATYTEPPDHLVISLQELEDKIETWAGKLKTPPERRITKVIIGSPVEQITEESKSHGLLVISTHGRTGLTHFLMGSVAERVVRSCQCAVLVVKQNQNWPS